jgi:ribosomal-protein-alanine N-acetyltransferase
MTMAHRVGVELTTARLRLRPCSAADVDALHALWTDPQVRRFLWDDVVIDRATAAERVTSSETSFAGAGWGLWAMEPLEGGTLIGVIGLVEMDALLGPEIVYASEALLDYAFEALCFAQVPGRTDTPNRASARVLERLGMTFVGEALVHGNPHVCYAISREDWQRARR